MEDHFSHLRLVQRADTITRGTTRLQAVIIAPPDHRMNTQLLILHLGGPTPYPKVAQANITHWNPSTQDTPIAPVMLIDSHLRIKELNVK